MYFVWLHKKTPEKCSINVLKKRFLGRFQVLEFFSSIRNDRIFLSSRNFKKTFIGMTLCILVDYTKKHPKIEVSMSSTETFFYGYGFSNFFRLLETTEIFFFLVLFERLDRHELMYLVWLHHRSPENCSIDALKKSFFGRIRVLEFFSTTRDDRILLSSRTFKKTYIGMSLCILVNYT